MEQTAKQSTLDLKVMVCLKVVLLSLCLAINICFWAIPICFAGALKFFLRNSKFFLQQINQLLTRLYEAGSGSNFLILDFFQVPRPQVEILGIDQFSDEQSPLLQREQIYLILANHQTAADILILQMVLLGRIPLPKFLIKWEMLYAVPVGQICWALDFPFLRRYSHSQLKADPGKRLVDKRSIREFLAKHLTTPFSVINFPEGTRFSPLKREKSMSPYHNLLRPKLGGLKVLMATLKNQSRKCYLVDATIDYGVLGPNLFQFLAGEYRTLKVKLELEQLNSQHCLVRELNECENDGSSAMGQSKHLREWLDQRWKIKDRELTVSRDSSS